jgi:peptidoglycan/LPS O-acetylase OafA/YrhL
VISTPATRIRALDGLRGVAVLLVLFHHTIRYFAARNSVNNRVLQFFESLHIGVDLFFVLSGFLITSILLEHRESSNYFKAFYWRRLLRIFPLYYLSLATFAIVEQGLLKEGRPLWYLLFGSNVLTTLKGPQPELLAPLWSIALEEQFYLLWPGVVLLLDRRALLTCCVGLFLLQPIVRAFMPEMAYTNPLMHLDGLLIGSAMAACMPEIRLLMRKYAKAISLASWISIAYIIFRGTTSYVRYWSGPLFFDLADFSLISLCFAILLLRTLSKQRELRVLNSSVIVRVGLYSYSIYLFHTLWMIALDSVGLMREGLRGVDSLMWAGVWSICVLIVSVALSHVIWVSIESRILRHRDRVNYAPRPSPVLAGV